MLWVQSYEKTSKEPNIFELFRVPSQFGVAKVTKKACNEQQIWED